MNYVVTIILKITKLFLRFLRWKILPKYCQNIDISKNVQNAKPNGALKWRNRVF